jgi:hypothetical protein
MAVSPRHVHFRDSNTNLKRAVDSRPSASSGQAFRENDDIRGARRRHGHSREKLALSLPKGGNPLPVSEELARIYASFLKLISYSKLLFIASCQVECSGFSRLVADTPKLPVIARRWDF